MNGTVLNSRRGRTGNMLVLSGTFMVVAAGAVVLALSFAGLLFTFNHLQTTADELAIAGARKLNELDRIGQMNNAIARSRQMVYSARENVEEAAHHPQVLELAQKLLAEAREGAQELEQQRVVLKNVNLAEAHQAVIEKFNQLKARHSLVLPWISASVPQVPLVRFGYIDQVESNVSVLKNLGELETIDRSTAVSRVKADSTAAILTPDLPERTPT